MNDMKEICVKGCELNHESILFYDRLRERIGACLPSDVHKIMAHIQKSLGEDRCIIFTQNVDDLLERAGCTKVSHVHGIINQTRCTKCGETFVISNDTLSIQDSHCKVCSGMLRYDIVYYGESAPEYKNMIETLIDMENDDVFVMIGTSCQALSVDAIVKPLKMKKVYINPVIEPNVDISRYQHVLLDKVENVLDILQNIISKYM
jgi:NAD-dependent deacetylase